jgi:hypothetical protein
VTVKLYVDIRPEWSQRMENPLGSQVVRERMEMLAASALLQFVHQLSVTVTAVDADGFAQAITRYRGDPPRRPACPHCGGFL